MMSRTRMAWIVLILLCCLAPTCLAADLNDVAAAWRKGDIAAARTLLTETSADELATETGIAWQFRLADDPASIQRLRSDLPAHRLDAAWIAWGRGDREAAASHLTSVLTGDQTPPPGAEFLAGLLARRSGDLVSARNALASVRPDDPSFAWARYTLGRIAAASGDAALAKRYYDNAEKAGTPVCRAEVLAATWELSRSSDPRQALRLERELENRFPESLPLIRIRELARRHEAVETGEAHADVPPSPAAAQAAGRYSVQLGAFADRGRALVFVDEWRGRLGDLVIAVGTDASGHSVHRIRSGTFQSRQRAVEWAEELQRDHGLSCMVVEGESGS